VRDDVEVRSYASFDRFTWRVARAFAVGVPAWVLVLWGFAQARLIPGAAFVLASLLATVITIGADRIMVASARARRFLPWSGVALVVVWSVVLPFTA
jgi:hypothetical protein